ncbi:MAG: DNA polymerase III subunit beta [Candidatus Andersenbacteria bacterium]
MKLACTQENLQKGLSIVGRVVSRNATLPVLGNVLLKTETGGLKLVATDLEVGVTCIVGGKVEQAGEITIPARLLAEYINQLPREHVTLHTDGKELRVACQETSAEIKGIGADEFPLLPAFKSVFEAVLPADQFKEAISQVITAVAHDESRPELTGVYLQFGAGGCTLAATDSFRLAERTIPVKGAVTERAVIVPLKTMAEIGRIIEPVDSVVLRLSENQIKCSYKNIELISRLIEGHYPPYKDILPKKLPTRCVVNREEFIGAVRSAGLFSKTAAQDVVVSVNAEKKQLQIQAEANQVGGHHQKLAASILGPSDRVVFNYRYLVEGLQTFTSEKIIFETGGSSSPGQLTAPESTGYLYILMPIKV